MFEGGILSRRGREMTVAIVVVGWLVCSFLTYGLLLGTFTHRYPYMRNTKDAIVLSVFGPFGVVVELMLGDFKWRLKPPSKEERWQAFSEEHGILGRAYFERHHG